MTNTREVAVIAFVSRLRASSGSRRESWKRDGYGHGEGGSGEDGVLAELVILPGLLPLGVRDGLAHACGEDGEGAGLATH